MHLFRSAFVLLPILTLIGCAADPSRTGEPPAIAVPSGQYASTFDAAKRTLRDRGFILERVDAQAGVITTQPKTTAGFVTPWDQEQQSLAQEGEDFLERQQRVVRITFEREGPVAAAADDAATVTDLRETSEPLAMRVHVTLQRLQIPGRKLEPEAIGQSSFYWDPALGARGMQPQYAVAIREDVELARRLAGLIESAPRN